MAEIERLQKELKEKQEMLMTSAKIGKGLLEENAILFSRYEELNKSTKEKIESLQQNNYSLSMKLEAKEKMIQCIGSELEHLEAQQNIRIEDIKRIQNEETSKLLSKINNHEKTIERLQDEIEGNESIIKELQESIKTLKETSIVEIFQNDISTTVEDSLHNQIALLTKEKSEAESKCDEIGMAFKQSSMKVCNLQKSLQQVKEELEYKECELTSLCNKIDKKNEEIQELHVELETAKLEQTDPKRRGNSLFAEVEDNRKLIERKYLELKEKFFSLERLYQYKHEQVHKMKLRISSLLALSARTGSLEYQNELQQTVSILNQELGKLRDYCKSLENKAKSVESYLKEAEPQSQNAQINLYKNQRRDAFITLEKKEKEVSDLLMSKVYLNDEIVELKKSLNSANRCRDELNAEVMSLKVRLEQECGVDLDKENEKLYQKTEKRVEVLPFIATIQKELERQRKLQNENNKIEQSHSSAGQKNTNEEITNLNVKGTLKDEVGVNKTRKDQVKINKKTLIEEVKKKTDISPTILKDHDSNPKLSDVENKENVKTNKRMVQFSEEEKTIEKEKPKRKLNKLHAAPSPVEDVPQCPQQ